MKNEDNSHDIGTIEVLDEQKKEEYVNKSEDIPTAFFKPIVEVQAHQNEMLENYKKQQEEKEVKSDIPDLSNEVRMLEKKLAKTKFSMPLIYVLLIVIVVNLCWFFAVKFLIVPKYEDYVKQNAEIKENYDTLKRKVEAIVGKD